MLYKYLLEVTNVLKCELFSEVATGDYKNVRYDLRNLPFFLVLRSHLLLC